MAQPCFHSSIEGAQHGAKNLEQFLDYAKRSGAAGAQPSNFMLEGGKPFKRAKEIKRIFEDREMKLDGISCHCPVWVHTTAWTGSPTELVAFGVSIGIESLLVRWLFIPSHSRKAHPIYSITAG